MTIEAGKLNNKMELWGKVPYKNDLGKQATKEGFIKFLWCDIIPQTYAMQRRPADTILVNCTHKIECRYRSSSMIKNDMFLLYKGRRFDIKYASDPYLDNTQMDIWVEEVIE